MRAVEIIKLANESDFIDEDGRKSKIELNPPLSRQELADLKLKLPCPMPEEIEELLLYCRGFKAKFFWDGNFDFAGDPGFEPDVDPSVYLEEEFLTYAFPFAYDRCGNQWMIDFLPGSSSYGPIYYVCHDPPVLVFQSANLTDFLAELFKMGNSPWQSEISKVHEDYAYEIWSSNPNVLAYEACLASPDSDLRDFAGKLDSSYLFIDLRKPKIGDGFSWGRFGAGTVCRRYGLIPIFAVQQRKLSLWQKIFGV